MSYTFHDITQIIPHFNAQVSHPHALIKQLLFDSRQLIFPSTSLFFAIVGERQDGHQYINDLYQKGVRNFVVQKGFDATKFPNANFIFVENTIQALQHLAQHHRKQFDLEIVGITGSNGKTIVKEWLFQLLQADFSIVRSPKSYNSQIGVPLSLWQIQASHQIGLFEAGISQKGEMKKLFSLIECEIGIFTHLGEAHNEGFTNLEEKLDEKFTLFKAAKTIICNIDHPLVAKKIQSFSKERIFSWSYNSTADLQIITQNNNGSATKIIALFKGKTVAIEIPFRDTISIENAITCWCFLLHKNIDSQVIQKRMLQLEAVEMRMEMKEGINNCLLINDSYNTDLSALEIAINFAIQQAKDRSISLILSDIYQTGIAEKELYTQVQKIISRPEIHRIIGIGKAIQALKNLDYHFSSTKDFLNQFDDFSFQNEVILLKGARIFQFERISNRLAKKAHRTQLEINLSALTHNLKIYSQLLKASTKLLVMVKAAAYGSGSVEVARLLEFHQVDYLGVAYIDEGIELRKKGIQLPILVLNPDESGFEGMIAHQLEPEIYSLQQLQQLYLHLKNKASHYPIHLKIDTGMHRLGFEEEQLQELIHFLQKHQQYFKIKSIFSHLSASEAPEHDDFTHQQAHLFLHLAQQIQAAFSYPIDLHLLNSSGISRFPQYQFNMVRLGIGLYGIESDSSIQQQLQVVSQLKARISQIKQVLPNETVGYNRAGKIKTERTIATISIGYADGLLRLAGNGNYQVEINGHFAPIVGNICMDMCMIDVSGIPTIQVGDVVEIFGNHLPIQKLASALKTIPYEVFTNISERVKRVYFQE